MKKIIARTAILLLATLPGLPSCTNEPEKNQSKKQQLAPSNLSGAQLAKVHCATCHQFPEPSALDKAHWEKGVLPQMAYRLGIYEDIERATLIEKGIGGQLVVRANIYPEEPILALEDFAKIEQYYIENAPQELKLARSEKLPSSDLFSLVEIEERFDPPMGTLLKSFPEKNRIIYADAKPDYCAIEIMDLNFKLIQRLAMPTPVSAIHLSGDTIVATSMGQFMPNDAPTGSIFKIFKPNGSAEYAGFFNLVKNLQRPVFTLFSDLDQDQREDILVGEYGHHTGGLNWYKNLGNRQYERRVLLAQPGASQAIIHDFNHDNLPDIIALMAQGDEGVDIYFNRGKGQFDRRRVLRFSPLSGAVNLHITDFDKDGHTDILYINGDNADYSIVDKPYHGVRIFINDGENSFSQKYFYELPGAYDAQLHDFDGDGDLDIAAIAFFPRDNNPENGFVYLENISKSKSEINFKAFAVAGTAKGRWIKMELNDIDGDKKMDITLLSFTGMDLTGDKDGQYDKWLKTSPSILHLRNNFK